MTTILPGSVSAEERRSYRFLPLRAFASDIRWGAEKVDEEPVADSWRRVILPFASIPVPKGLGTGGTRETRGPLIAIRPR